jgi:threonine aldolase
MNAALNAAIQLAVSNAGNAAEGAPVDLRSDTVTRPDAAMRLAMAGAVVGDDVYGEDPTVRRLEEEAADRVGHEAALFVPSGTMGNQIALHLHGSPGSEVLGAADSHVFLYEMGALAALSGLMAKPLPSDAGRLDPATVAAALPPDLPYRSRAKVLVIENSVNMTGGRVYGRARLEPLLALAKERKLAVHLDGARVFNAAASLNVDVKELTRGFSSVMFCLSKGLGAPVGSLLCGGKDFIAEAWRMRKMFGGGMRQAGVLAAPGLLALREGPERLAEDHDNAAFLAAALADVPGIEIDPATVETNIVIFRLNEACCGGDARRFCGALGEKKILCSPVAADKVRMVTHRDVGRQGVEKAIAAVAALN